MINLLEQKETKMRLLPVDSLSWTIPEVCVKHSSQFEIDKILLTKINKTQRIPFITRGSLHNVFISAAREIRTYLDWWCWQTMLFQGH